MFKVGQTVWCILNGKGVVDSIDNVELYPVNVTFDDGTMDNYTTDGKIAVHHNTRTLYFSKPIIDAALEPVFVPQLFAGDAVLVVSNNQCIVGDVVAELKDEVHVRTSASLRYYPKETAKFYRVLSVEEIKF